MRQLFRPSVVAPLLTGTLHCPSVPQPPSLLELRGWRRRARWVNTLLTVLVLVWLLGLACSALLCEDLLTASATIPVGLIGFALLVKARGQRSLNRHNVLDWPELRRVEALARTLPGTLAYLASVRRDGRSLVIEDADRLQRYQQALDRWKTADAAFATMSAEQHALRLAHHPEDISWWHGFRSTTIVTPTPGNNSDAHDG